MTNTQRIIHLHQMATEFRAIGSWAMAEYLEKLILELLTKEGI